MLAAMIVAFGQNMVLPLMPDIIVRQDGAEKQYCERNVARCWRIAPAECVSGLRPVYLVDALFSSRPMAEAVRATAADFLLVRKRDSHKALYGCVDGAPLENMR